MSARSVCRSSQCCTLRQKPHRIPHRRFGTARISQAPEAAAASTSTIPPESPKFIPIPRPVQPPPAYKPWVKGILPVPRKLFRPRDPNKTSPEYLASLTPEPRPQTLQKQHTPQTKDLVSYKTRQSSRRRQNMRESLIELHLRKDITDRRVAARSARTRASNLAALHAPEREDERLTNATILQSDLPRKRSILPDPDREQRLAIKAGNIAAHKAAQEDERQDMLHNLYVNAGQFITTPAQLDGMVDRVFDNEDAFSTADSRGENVWHLGNPDTVEQLLRSSGKGRRRAGQRARAVGERPRERVADERTKRVGEELTGGKMSG